MARRGGAERLRRSAGRKGGGGGVDQKRAPANGNGARAMTPPAADRPAGALKEPDPGLEGRVTEPDSRVRDMDMNHRPGLEKGPVGQGKAEFQEAKLY